MFNNVVLREPLHKSCSGSKFETQFKESFDEQGVYTVVPDSQYNLWEYIQSSKEDADIYSVLKRVSNGEIGLLSKKEGQFLDVSSLPENIHEAHKIVSESYAYFNSLPADIKSQYHNSANEFFADVGSEHFASLFVKPDSSKSNLESEVEDNG